MPAHRRPHGLADCQGHVEQKLAAGDSFASVEDYIDASALPSRQQAALWLLAWAHQKPTVQLRLAKETLAHVSNMLEPSA